MNAVIWIFLTLGCLLQLPVANAAPAAAAAASPQQPSVRLALVKVVAKAGKEELVPAASIAPGDVVEYQAVYLNPTPATARNVQVTLPVPAGGLEPVLSRLGPQAVTASLDGKHFEAVPLMRTQTLVDGATVKSAVPAAEYRFLRWTLGDLPSGATRTVSARMQLPALSSPIALAGPSSSATPSAP